MLRLWYIFVILLYLTTVPAAAGAADGARTDVVEAFLDRIVEGEQVFLNRMQGYHPLMELYVQSSSSEDRKAALSGDEYAMGQVTVASDGVKWSAFTESAGFASKGRRSKFGLRSARAGLLSGGFAQMIVPDAYSFDRTTYEFSFQRREFLGEIRTLVFEVQPQASEPGRFIGRVWVDERSAQIVRFNGTFTGDTKNGVYFHFDSWRINTVDNFWAPAYIYIQDEDESGNLGARFAAQARLWNYQPVRRDEVDELTGILIEQASIEEEEAWQELTPLEAERSWREEAQRNVLRRLEIAGLLAPRGPVDEVAETVVRNLMASNGLALDIECRILLTTPLETFSIGHAIVISRGLIDVLPDEASLAMALSTELAHAALGHRMNSMYGFGDLTIFDDSEILHRLRLNRQPQEVSSASTRALEMLELSPYASEMANAGLFLQALASRAPTLPQLIRSNFGNALASQEKMSRLESIARMSPDLDEDSLDQIAALPLGSRVQLNPWSNEVSLRDVRPAEIRSVEDKLPFQVTPFVPHLRRFKP
jgi:hypothetical protein